MFYFLKRSFDIRDDDENVFYFLKRSFDIRDDGSLTTKCARDENKSWSHIA